MNRRTSIKSLSFLGIVGLFSFPVYKLVTDKNVISMNNIDEYKPLIAELAELLIPRTDTPGAKDALVEDFIVLVVKDCDTKQVQRNFIQGLNEVLSSSLAAHKRPFMECSLAEKKEILLHVKERSMDTGGLLNKLMNRLLGVPFYAHLHALTVEGYCTSQLGATQALSYDYIPGQFKGCIPLEKNQKNWAT